jgi:Holliday junction resolvase
MALESNIQIKIINQLTKEGWLCIKLIKTNCNGIPDLVCFRNGKTKFIEVKQPNGKLSIIQNYRHEQLKKQGFTVHVWTAYNEDFQE